MPLVRGHEAISSHIFLEHRHLFVSFHFRFVLFRFVSAEPPSCRAAEPLSRRAIYGRPWTFMDDRANAKAKAITKANAKPKAHICVSICIHICICICIRIRKAIRICLHIPIRSVFPPKRNPFFHGVLSFWRFSTPKHMKHILFSFVFRS